LEEREGDALFRGGGRVWVKALVEVGGIKGERDFRWNGGALVQG